MSAGGRVALAAVGVVVLVAAVVGGILYLRDEDPPSAYDAAIEDDFMATCTADAEALGFARAADFCRCAYDRLRADLDFDRFLEIDAAIAEDPTAVPRVVERIRAACYVETEAGASPTVPAP